MEMENKGQFEFSGFESPNYTPVPDEVFDRLLARLTGAETKVLLYIIRRTFGFKKGSDRISKSQLESGIIRTNGEVIDYGTGLSRRAVRLAVQSLVDKKVLLKKSVFSAVKGNEATEYALNVKRTNPWVNSTQGGGKKVPKPLGIEVPPQETVLQDNNVNVAFKTLEHDTIKTNGARSTETMEETMRIGSLVEDILTVFHDTQSKRFYHKAARLLPEAEIRSALSTTRYDTMVDPSGRGKVRNPAAIFTNKLKEIAIRAGVAL